jgi:GNAT superfamily N-acetyltransferase
MITELGQVALKSGENMTVKLLVPPEPDYTDKLLHFLEHKGEQSRRGIRQRLEGKYADICVDRYFIGEIDGKIAGQLWYGYSASGTGIANFGHVYTEPEHRGKSITNRLLDFFSEDFNANPVRAALCGTGTPWVANIYLKYGFMPVLENSDRGSLYLLKNECGKNFAEFEQSYFTPGKQLDILTGTMEQRHDIDCMLRNAFMIRDTMPVRLALAAPVTNYENAIFRVEDGGGLVSAAVTPERHVVGWAFLLATGSALERESKIFDFEIHPAYRSETDRLIAETLRMCREKGMSRAWACCDSSNTEKHAALLAAGFREEALLPEYLRGENGNSDLHIFIG